MQRLKKGCICLEWGLIGVACIVHSCLCDFVFVQCSVIGGLGACSPRKK